MVRASHSATVPHFYEPATAPHSPAPLRIAQPPARSFTCNQFYNITGASSAKATCGPVNGMSACNALISAGKNCVYHYAQYTCDQPSCSQGSFDACNSLCLTLDPDYVGPCTNSCHTWCGTAEA